MPIPGPTSPHVCLRCRRSFKQPWLRFEAIKCPICKQRTIVLHENFKAPRSNNHKQWAKVRLLVESGFRFRPIWDEEAGERIPYPETLRDAVDWVKRWKYLAATRGGPSVAEPSDGADRSGLTVSQIKKRAWRRAGR